MNLGQAPEPGGPGTPRGCIVGVPLPRRKGCRDRGGAQPSGPPSASPYNGLPNANPCPNRVESMPRTVFFTSDSTAITSETVGQSMLAQFENVEFKTIYMPFINTREKAERLLDRVRTSAARDQALPIVFGTFPEADINRMFRECDCCRFIDLFDPLVGPLSEELGVPPTRKQGRSHAVTNSNTYDHRIDAIHFTLANDDGSRPENFTKADVVLVGVSRSGKTPTCLYLALHFGLKAANYPLTEEDFAVGGIPPFLIPVRDKLFGLTIDPQRLLRIRQERRPNSEYAAPHRCQDEVRKALAIFGKLDIPVFDTTSNSIEEISSRIMKNLFKKSEIQGA